MDKTLSTPFKVTPSLTKMRDNANQIAKDMGFKDKSREQDAFRHAYVSAKIQEFAQKEISPQVIGHRHCCFHP